MNKPAIEFLGMLEAVQRDIGKCERCNYDEADPTEPVAEYFADRYLAVCKHCARELYRIQAKQADWSDH